MQKRVPSTSIKSLSVLQICLLISTTFAFAFFLGQSIPTVSAALKTEPPQIAKNPSAAYRANVQPLINEGFGDYNFADSIQVSGREIAVETVKQGGSTYYVTEGGQAYQAFTNPATGEIGYRLAAGQAGYAGGSLGVGPFTLASSQNFFVGNLYTGISHAIAVVGVVALIASLAGASGEQTKAISAAAASGILSYRLLVGAFGKGGGVAGNQGVLGQFLQNKVAGGIAVGIAVAVFVLLYKKETQKQVTFQCLPWEPQLGGSKCEECNKDPFRPCSEYRCKSLGQACELLNPNTNKAQCAWVSKGDVQSPTIQEWTSALRPTNLQYTPNNAVRPGARGVTIVSPDTEDGCLPAFTNLQFGVLTNEPAQCKIDYNRSVSFDAMQFYFGESNFYEYNHTQRMRLPSPDNDETDISPLLQNDGTFGLFVRCRDANGNVNEDEYMINFCVAAGPDTTAPVIEGTSIESGSPVRFNADTVPLEVYTNEPAQCKWSNADRDYAEMENSFTCAQSATQVNADLQYTCAGNLTGIANSESKEFFIRCQDQPTAAENVRNTMSESYRLSLRGTEELTLLAAGPNATTISASTSAIPVELFAQTDDGADQGKATCFFSTTGTAGSYVEFFETEDITHKQTLSLSAGNYSYSIRCIDAGGNNAEANITFSVAHDNTAPQVARVYKRGDDALQIITNEDAQCFYSKTSCNFEIEDGLQMTYPNAEQQRVHITQWKAKSAYYIKCKDTYGNQPSPNSCSIIVSGSDLSARAVFN